VRRDKLSIAPSSFGVSRLFDIFLDGAPKKNLKYLLVIYLDLISVTAAKRMWNHIQERVNGAICWFFFCAYILAAIGNCFLELESDPPLIQILYTRGSRSK